MATQILVFMVASMQDCNKATDASHTPLRLQASRPVEHGVWREAGAEEPLQPVKAEAIVLSCRKNK